MTRGASTDDAAAAPGSSMTSGIVLTRFDIPATLTGERLMSKFTGGRERPLRDDIARLAYHLYERRGRQDGQDLDDWLSAERELARHYPGTPSAALTSVNTGKGHRS